MGLRFLEHALILTHDPAATRDWFVANLGFTEGYHPEFGFPVHWLYIGKQDVLHIGKANHSAHQNTYLSTPGDGSAKTGAAASAGAAIDDSGLAPGSGRIDHLCFNCDGLPEFIERLNRNRVAFSERKAHNSELFQLFMREPINGIKLELNFSAQEAAADGRSASWTSTGKPGS